jgi:PAP2 superfamily protein
MIPPPPHHTTSVSGGPGAPWRRALVVRPWAFEVLLFLFALLVYQASRALLIGDDARAFANAAEIIRWERTSGMYVELNIQQFLLAHLNLTKALNYFYVYAHWVVTALFFVWLYRRRPAAYPYVRNGFLAANAIALAIFIAYPVAPPRLLGGAFVDTLTRISDIDLHAGRLSSLFNPYAAVPSMHFGYALMIAAVAVVLVRSWTLRLGVAVYPVVVFIAITGTANHYVLDSVAGSVVVAAGFLAVAVWMRVRTRVRPAAAPAASGP